MSDVVARGRALVRRIEATDAELTTIDAAIAELEALQAQSDAGDVALQECRHRLDQLRNAALMEARGGGA